MALRDTSRSRDLTAEIEAEARDAAEAHFGPNVTAEQVARVRGCAWESFRFHCATGDDLDCTCGAHVLPEQPAVEYQPEDFG